MLSVYYFLLSLVYSSFAACNSASIQADILRLCKSAHPSRACPAPCLATLQAAYACEASDRAVSSLVQRFAFCKPKAKCRLVLQKESCTGTCQWCNNKCLAATAKCQTSAQCSMLQEPQCTDQCEWCAGSRTCAPLKQCPPSSVEDCQDDPAGTLASFGYDCALLLEVTNNKCDFDLTGIDTSLKGVTPGKLCPKSCSQCSQGSASTAASQSPTDCKDDPAGLVAAQGFDCTTIMAVTANNCDFDLHALSPAIPEGITPGQLCPQSCKRCEDQATGARSTENVADDSCQDDPEGLVAEQGLTCTSIMEYAANDCGLDLSSINPNVPQGLTPGRLCPKTCKTCNQKEAAASPASGCVDDPTGMVARYGFTCKTILGVTGNDCEKDLNTLSGDIPKGVTPGQLCPKSCARCADAEGNTAPVPQKTTDTFINGRLMSSTERSWLAGLGVEFPPGRYFIRPDGSAGIEGGPVLLNIYQMAGQRVDTVITQAMRNSGIEGAAIKTRDGAKEALEWTKTAGRTVGQSLTQAASTTRTGFQNFISSVSNFFRG